MFSSCLNLDKVDIEHVLMPSIYYVFYYLFGINYLQSTIYYTDKSRAIHTTRRAVTMVETTVVCDPVLHRSSLQAHTRSNSMSLYTNDPSIHLSSMYVDSQLLIISEIQKKWNAYLYSNFCLCIFTTCSVCVNKQTLKGWLRKYNLVRLYPHVLTI